MEKQELKSVLKQFTETPAINIGGHFGVVDNNKRNIIKRSDASFENIMYSIRSTHPEIKNNPKLYAAVAEMVRQEMQPTEYVEKTR